MSRIRLTFIGSWMTFFSILCLFPSDRGCAQEKVQVSSQEKINQMDAKGRRQGLWITQDRKLNYRGYFKDGMPTGWFEYTGKSDTLVAKAFYFRGGYASYNQFFRPDGSMMCDGFYLDKKKDSLWTFYASDGRVLKQESYEMGLLDGTRILYDDSGCVQERQCWFRGLRNGPWWIRDEKGYQSFVYKLNLSHGEYLARYPDSVLSIRGTYKEGLKEGKWSFYLPSGTLYKEDFYEGNQLKDRLLYVKVGGKVSPIAMDTVRLVMLNPQGGRAEIFTGGGSRLVCDDRFEYVCGIFDIDYFFYANKNTFVAYTGVDKDEFYRQLEELGMSETEDVVDGQLDPSLQLGVNASVSPIRLPLKYEPPFPVFLDSYGVNNLKNILNEAAMQEEKDGYQGGSAGSER